MISLFVVDDEKYIRESLCYSIAWNQYDIELVGSAENGEDAYAFLSAHDTDIVITDIRMPDIDGIELIRRLREKGGSTCFIILSGFDEFEYAQKAIQYRVSAYLLKPCGKDEIVETVLSLTKRFRREDDSAKRIERLFIESSERIPNTLQLALRYIEKNYMLDITRDMVAEQAFISSSYLSVLFKKYCRLGFSEYLNEVRIEHACKLLNNEQSLKIFEVAECVGFRDERYFSTVFRKRYGISPSEYRNASLVEK